jgi:hypothetical protein
VPELTLRSLWTVARLTPANVTDPFTAEPLNAAWIVAPV